MSAIGAKADIARARLNQSRRNKAPGLFLDGSIFVCTTFDRLPFKSQSLPQRG
jgi:hypothetical protein